MNTEMPLVMMRSVLDSVSWIVPIMDLLYLADSQRVQVLGGLGRVFGVDEPGRGHLGQGFGYQGHDPLAVPEIEDHGEVRRLGDKQADQGGALGGAGDGPDDLADARGEAGRISVTSRRLRSTMSPTRARMVP